MLFRDPRLASALGLTLAEQLLLALSTYFIAQAGAALAVGDLDRVLRAISLFFSFALLAYVGSSAASLLSTRAANRIWHRYTHATLRAATPSLQYASDSNRKSIAQWLGGEALSTIAQACDLQRELLSASLNILFTLAVFYLALGWQIASAIAVSLLASFALVLVQRQRIERSAAAMQHSRQAATLAIEPTWNGAMFGSRAMRAQALCKLDAKAQFYFAELHAYVLLEQAVACGPVIMATLALLGLIQFTGLWTASIAGALVALLPRSLQVFGNVHALSVYLSQFFLLRAKLRTLDGFCTRLERFPLHQVSLHAIGIQGPRRHWAAAELLEGLWQGSLARGRWTVTGPNGSGKSTLLKIIKDSAADAILITPETYFLDAGSGLSTGQRRIKEIENVLSMAPDILLLDEWDANLDEGNCGKIDRLLDEASRRMLIIEVRHLRSGGHPSAGGSSCDPSTGSGLGANTGQGLP